jgi:hypothetical protein
MSRSRVAVLLFAFLALCAAAWPLQKSALSLAKTIPLPGVTGRFDHFALDIKGNRLFVAALGNNTLKAIDLVAGKRLQSIAGLPKPTGVLYLADRNQLFVACGDDGSFKVFDGVSLRSERVVTGLDDADNVRFDTKTGLIYLGYGSGALAVIRAATAEKIASIELAAHPESFQLEKNGRRIFVNVPDARQISVVDRERGAVIATWPMETFQANFPMALDEPGRRLFVGCRNPARLVVLDTTGGRKVADLAISGDVDDLFYDAARHRLYASCGDGFVDIIAQQDSDNYERLDRIPTAPGARTSYFSPELGQFFLAVPERGAQKAEIWIFDVK